MHTWTCYITAYTYRSSITFPTALRGGGGKGVGGRGVIRDTWANLTAAVYIDPLLQTPRYVTLKSTAVSFSTNTSGTIESFIYPTECTTRMFYKNVKTYLNIYIKTLLLKFTLNAPVKAYIKMFLLKTYIKIYINPSAWSDEHCSS
jgi:hypothetical protein